MRIKTLIGIALLAWAIQLGITWWRKSSHAPAPDRMNPVKVAPTVKAAPIKPIVPADAPPAAPVAVEPASPKEDAQSPEQADPQAEAPAAVADILRRLKASDIAGVMKNYVPPSEIAAMSDDNQARIAQIVEDADANGTRTNQALQRLIQVLESAPDTPPTYNEAGDHATFPTLFPATADAEGIPLRFPERLELIREGDRWYIY